MLKSILALTTLIASSSFAQAPPKPLYTGAPGDYIAHDFHFGSGETLPELKLHYLTLGTPHRNAAGHVDNAVLLLHGTGGDAHSLFNPVFSGPLFGPGEPLDITKYYLIFPDDIGHGVSSKPSDGLHMKFPHYDYSDMVRSQQQMLVEGLHVDHLRLVIGTSMGCMQSFVWGETFPDFADALMPLACNAVPLAGRNRMMRYMAIENIERDPAWKKGEYTTEPIEGLRAADEMILIMGMAPLQMQKNYPAPEAAEKDVDSYLERALKTGDANNMIYYLDASRNYDSSKSLAKITAPMMWINSADDFVNPPELGIAQQQVKEMPHAKFILLPITDATRGHGTHTVASIWKDYLIELLKESEPDHATVAAAQSTYDVVSIHPNNSPNDNRHLSTDPGTLSFTNVTLKQMLAYAYGIREGLIEGLPGWADSAHFDVSAKVIDPDLPALKSMSREQRAAMMVPVLADRFGVKVHFETKTLPVYDLVVLRGAPRFTDVGDAKPSNMGAGSINTHFLSMKATGIPISSLAEWLSNLVDKTVIDKTGLISKYDLELKFTPDNARSNGAPVEPTDQAPAIYTALQEQLGLKLVPSKGPVATLVVDQVKQPTEN
jgi:homoserine O-acetyltransferase